MVDYNGLENRRAERHRGFESLSLRKQEASDFLMPLFVAYANRVLTFFQSLRLVKAPLWVERESLSLRKQEASVFSDAFFVAVANRGLTVLSVASL